MWTAAPVDKLECVNEAEQRALTKARHDERARIMARRWRETARAINAALDALVADQPTNSGVRSAVRAVRRSTDALGLRLGVQ